MLGNQQSSALNSSSLGSPVSSSLAGDPLVDSRLTQKLVQRDDDDEELLAHGDNIVTDLRDGSPAEGFRKTTHQPTSMNLPISEAQNDRQGTILSKGGLKVSGPAQNSQMNTTVGSADLVYENHSSGDVSLRHVLSDAISGLLMEDAMITPCGHSFGISGLRRVVETNLCLTCGASVPSDLLIPNYALRAAVLAYKRDGTRRKKDLSVQAESDGRRFSRVLADSDVSRPRGVQFPYVANDRVLIKGNKRTPERFVGREAIITTQCLNGWYLVKTLDNGESVRLQYRSLQKVGDKETITELEARVGNGKLTERTCKFNGLKGPSMSLLPTSVSADCKEGSPSKFNDKIRVGSFPSGITKGIRSESLSRTNRTNRGRRRGNQLRIADASGASWHSGRTSSNSSQELQGEQVKKVLDLHNLQVHGMCAQEAVTMYDSADDDKRATKRIAALGTTGGVMEGLAAYSNCSIRERKAMNSKVWGQTDDYVAEVKAFKEVEAVNAGEHVVGRGPHGARSQGKHSRARPKHNSVQTQNFLSARPDLQEADPYKKVYVSGFRRRASGGDGHELMTSKQSALASLNMDTDHCGRLPFEDHPREAGVKTNRESNGSQSVASFCETIRKGMLDLETEIPWSCMRSDWKTCEADWLQMLHKSSSVKDVGRRLEELRRALVLEKAGNMSDDEWSEKLEAAVELEAVDAVDHLWKRLREDISKLMDSKLKRDGKPLSNMKFEFLELKNLFPDLCIGGLSHVGMITATSMAAAEAYAVGEQNIETLLAIPMKLVQEHSNQDLRAVIDAIEREKRHLSAKVSSLGSGCNTKANSRIEDGDNVLIENPKQVPVSPSFLAVESAPLMTRCSNEETLLRSDGRCMDYDAAPLVDADSEEEVVPMEETDGEETDLSDSD